MISIDNILDDIHSIKKYINNIVEYNLDTSLALEYLIDFLNRLDNLYYILSNMIIDYIDIDDLLTLLDNEYLEDFSDVIYELNISDKLYLTKYL